LRQRKDLSQAELARLLGTSQNAIYRLENPRYGRPNISTLKKLASFYDVGLIVRFAPISEIADWTTDLSQNSMDVPSFDHDTGFMEHGALDQIAANATTTAALSDIRRFRNDPGLSITENVVYINHSPAYATIGARTENDNTIRDVVPKPPNRIQAPIYQASELTTVG
jgi:transcriptional regulator with XRE-family HTH domain